MMRRDDNPQQRRGPVRIGNVLAAEMSRLGLARIDAARRLERAWEALLGAELAAFTQPGKVQGGTLEVMVGNSVLMQELTFRKIELVEKLKQEVPDQQITDIRFRVGVVKT